MSTTQLSIYAVGDMRFNRPNPESLFELALPTLKKADILFGQLECSMSDRGVAQRASFHVRPNVSPKSVSGLTFAGFDIISYASNTTLGTGEDAMLDTIDVLRNNNITVIGVGKNIKEARKPAIIERKGTKVGLLAYCSVVPKGFEAGEDRSGVAPMRASTYYEQVDWQPGTPPNIITTADKDDLAAMVDDIKKVRPLVDILIMSIHWGIHMVPAVIAMYQKEVAYAAIDAGVDLILGHHAHILKGIEVYKGKVIFYSLGNFVLPSFKDASLMTMRLYGREGRDDHEYPDYQYPVDLRKSMVAKCLISNKKIEKVSYLPVMINPHAQPGILPRSDKRSSEVFDYIEWCCRDQGLDTRFSWEGDEVVVLT
ncbi:CapA family protein [Chloroflexota bacterium]